MNVNTSKICYKCNETKVINDFEKNRNICKICYFIQRKENKDKRIERDKNNPELDRICYICNINKKVKDFCLATNKCKECHANKNKGYYNNRKKEIRENIQKNIGQKQVELMSVNEIICLKCNSYISPSNFNVSMNKCKECHRKKHREYMINRKIKDPLFKFISNYRTRVYKILNKIKTQSTKELLGEDISIIKKWLEFSFTKEMTFNNQGSIWHVDHVIPISKFQVKNEEDVIECFNWKNLCPLLKRDNITKKDNILTYQVKEHINKLRLFVSTYYIDKYNEVEEYISDVFLPFLTKI
jgi:hypothetical protein